MDLKESAFAVLLFFLLICAPCGAAKEEETPSDLLISRAIQLEEIWTEPSPPMRMRAQLQVSDGKGGIVGGSYTYDWVSPSKWRELIHFGNYERLRVGTENGYWQKTGIDYQPEVIFQLETLLNLKRALRLSPKQFLGKVKMHEKDGIRQSCAEIKRQSGTDRILCFSEDTGVLLSMEYPRAENQSLPEISRIDYSSFNTIAGKLVPHEVQALRDGKLVASVKVLEIAKVTEINSALFTMPDSSEFWAHCDDMRQPELADRVAPTYPQSARESRASGRVVLYVVVEADGKLSNLTVIHHANSALEASSVEAVRQWRYKPAACGQAPIRLEAEIDVDYYLKQ
jgi:TonB family protein